MSIVSHVLQVNKKTSNRCTFSSVFHMSTEIYQIDINLLYVLLNINRKTSIIDVNSSTYLRRQLKDVRTYKLSSHDLDDKGNPCIRRQCYINCLTCFTCQ